MSASSVYFIECAGRIKVGYSTNVGRRVRDLATAAPSAVALLGDIAGGLQAEAAIHRRLDAHRLNGEWFLDCPEVREVIADLMQHGVSAVGAGAERAPKSWGNEEFARALKKLAEPLSFHETTKIAIGRAADRAGLSYWRAFDIWYCKARRIDAHEAKAIESALATHRLVPVVSTESGDIFPAKRAYAGRGR
jgi:hypothetical protein